MIFVWRFYSHVAPSTTPTRAMMISPISLVTAAAPRDMSSSWQATSSSVVWRRQGFVGDVFACDHLMRHCHSLQTRPCSTGGEASPLASGYCALSNVAEAGTGTAGCDRLCMVAARTLCALHALRHVGFDRWTSLCWRRLQIQTRCGRYVQNDDHLGIKRFIVRCTFATWLTETRRTQDVAVSGNRAACFRPYYSLPDDLE